MKTMNRLMTVAIGGLLAACISVAYATPLSLINTSGDDWKIEFPDLSLTMLDGPPAGFDGPGSLSWLVFEDFFDNPCTSPCVYGKIDSHGSQSLSIAINGGSPSSFAIHNGTGTWNGAALGGLDNNDLYINIAGNGAFGTASGTVTVMAGAVSFTAANVPTFSKSQVDAAFYSRRDGERQTEFLTISTVPEPTTIALLALGLLGAGFAKRRRARGMQDKNAGLVTRFLFSC